MSNGAICELEKFCNTDGSIVELFIRFASIDFLYEMAEDKSALPETLSCKTITDVIINFNQDNRWTVTIWQDDWEYMGRGDSIAEAAMEAIYEWNSSIED